MTEYLSGTGMILDFVTNYGVEGLIYLTLGISSLSVLFVGALLLLVKKLGHEGNSLHFLRAFTIGIFLADIALRQIPVVPEDNIYKLFILLGVGFSFFLERFLYREVSIFIPNRVASVVSTYNFRSTPMRKARAERSSMDVSPQRSLSPTPTTPKGRTKVILKNTGSFWLGAIFTTIHTYTLGVAIFSLLNYTAIVTHGSAILYPIFNISMIHVAGQVSLIKLSDTPIPMTVGTVFLCRMLGILLLYLGQKLQIQDMVERYVLCALIGNMLVISMTGLMATIGTDRKPLPIAITLVGIFAGISALWTI